MAAIGAIWGNDVWDVAIWDTAIWEQVSVAPPELTAAILATDGNSITLSFSKEVVAGAGGSAGLAVTASGGAVTATYSSGLSGKVLVYTLSRTISNNETASLAYTQPGDGLEDTTGADVVTFSGYPVAIFSARGVNRRKRGRGQAQRMTLEDATIEGSIQSIVSGPSFAEV